MISYAQNFEDVLLDRCFRNVSNGFYIDVGAWDPVVDSVTHHFYEKGWHGINVEPYSDFYEVLRAARPRDTNLMLALGDREQESHEFTIFSGGGISTLRRLSAAYLANLESRGLIPKTVDVPMTTLSNVCRDHVGTEQRIDFLKVDVEGWEEQVLRGHDWSRWRPLVIVVESITPVSFDEVLGRDVYADLSIAWEHIVLENGYLFAFNDGVNRFYVREESPELLEHFQVPVNCLDLAIQRSAFTDREELAGARAHIQSLKVEKDNYKQYVETKERELDGAYAELLAQRQRVESLLSSTSWRVTAPLRSASDRFKLIRHGSAKPRSHVVSQGINVVGYFSDTSGIAEASRSTLRCIDRARFPMSTLDVGPGIWHDEANEPNGSDHSMRYAVSVVHDNIALAHDKPTHYSVGAEPFGYTIGFWYWELAELPQQYWSSFDLVDEVWVPSSFVHDALQPHTDKPVTVVPPSVDFQVPNPLGRASFNLPSDRFLFLTMASTHSVLERKNPLGVIDAFEMAFGDSDQVGLVVKITDLHHRPDMAEAVREAARRAPVYVLDERVSRPEILGLMACTDAFVSLHRSEGFGLPIVEAMALGKPAVTTAYSGNMDVTNAETAFLVRYDLVELTRSHAVYPAGFHWAEPDLESAADEMRSVFLDDDRRIRIARAGREHVQVRCDSSVGAAVISDRMKVIAGR